MSSNRAMIKSRVLVIYHRCSVLYFFLWWLFLSHNSFFEEKTRKKVKQKERWRRKNITKHVVSIFSVIWRSFTLKIDQFNALKYFRKPHKRNRWKFTEEMLRSVQSRIWISTKNTRSDLRVTKRKIHFVRCSKFEYSNLRRSIQLDTREMLINDIYRTEFLPLIMS